MHQRVSIFNCVSTALEMLKFSSGAILNNAGYDNFDYIIVTWHASEGVSNYLNDLKGLHGNRIHIIAHETDHNIGFVPNLRSMMNDGFNYGFSLNPYCGLVNTDQYFGKDWLINLVKYTQENEIVNSTHITPIKGEHVITANLGIPEYGQFDMKTFNDIYDELYNDILETEDERGGWLNTNTMPYLFHRNVWDKCGPWELTLLKGSPPPDRRFFTRCHEAGVKFTMSRSSIVYHHEGVERRKGRKSKLPDFAKGMDYE